MTEFRIELPLPPPANSAYPTNWRTKRRYLSPAGKAWKTEAGWLVQIVNPPKILGPYEFQILVPDRLVGDVDGRIKLAQDLMVELGVTPDDRMARESRATRDGEVPQGKCIVSVRAVS